MRTLAFVLTLLASASTASAAEINALMTTAMKEAFDILLPPFERANGHTTRIIYGPGGALLRHFNGGQAADLFVTDTNTLDTLMKDGKLTPGRTELARIGIGIAVRKGAPKPDVSNAEALKRALLAAKSVGYTSPDGGSITAAHVKGVFEKLGVWKEVAAKSKYALGGVNSRVSVLVSSGEAEIGFQQASELYANPDVEVIGMLPAELQLNTIYAGSVTASAKQPEAARAMIGILSTPEAMAVYKSKGLQ